MEALERFREVIAGDNIHGKLLALEDDGWEELFPDEHYWRFRHPFHPGIEIRWSPGHRPQFVAKWL